MSHSDAFVQLCEAAKSRIQETTVDAVFEMQNNNQAFILIDVREDQEWEAGHLPNAIHLSKGIIERDIEKNITDKKQAIVLYCGGGYRSALSAVNLQQMGFTNVLSMDGGYRAWIKNNYPIEK